MAFSGNLEDLAIADVLQLLHVSRKSGTLRLTGPEGEVAIAFKDGDVIGANHPSKKINIGGILVKRGDVTEQDIDQAVAQQQEAGQQRRPLLATLVAMGCVDEKKGWRALENLIEETLIEIVAWRSGEFGFEVDNIEVFDEFRHFPESMSPMMPMDTQRLLMDAIRILDERNQGAPVCSLATEDELPSNSDPEPEPEPVPKPRPEPESEPDCVPMELWAEEETDTSYVVQAMTAPEQAQEKPTAAQILSEVSPMDADKLLSSMEVSDQPTDNRSRADRKVTVFCQDGFVKHSLHTVGKGEGIEIFTTEIDRDILRRLDGWIRDDKLPVLVADMSVAANGEQWLRKGKRLLQRAQNLHSEVTVVVLTDGGMEAQKKAFSLGAKTVLVRPVRSEQADQYVVQMKTFFQVLIACFNSAFGQRDAMVRRVAQCMQQMAMLRQRVNEIQWGGEESPEISLVVLKYVADFLDRCIIFLVRRGDLIGLGAFGVDDCGETLSSAVVKLKIPLAETSILKDVVEGGMVFQGVCHDPLLYDRLYKNIGAPASPEVVLLPLKTSESTVALIYGDFGPYPAAPVQTDALEIMACQAGMAFQIALLRRSVDAGKLKPEKKETKTVKLARDKDQRDNSLGVQ